MKILLVVALLGCAVDEPEYAETESELATSNRLAGNRLAANRLAANRLAGNKLSLSALPSSSTLIDSADGREVLSYIVSCALPSSASLTVTSSTGVAYKFSGSIGLAPAWATRAPTVSERRWVSACVLARTNLYGVSVNISMRGPHSALKTSLLEPVTYAIPEAAFYGDLFDASGTAGVAYTCIALLKETGLSLTTLSLRECSVPGPDGETTACGFTYAGKCGVVDGPLQPACDGIQPPYTNCRTPSGQTYAEVITILLATL